MVRLMMNLTTLPLSFWEYTLEYANMVPSKKVDKTPYKLWYGKVLNLSYLKETMGYYFYFPPENKIVVTRCAEFFEKNLISQESSGRAVELEEIQDEDTSPSKNTSEHLVEAKKVAEHSLGDLNEPTKYKAALSDTESAKWLDAMNAEMQSMKDNQVW
ncbi:retrotransposon protein, putative, ty1-copia subclass, partial [Tanacetum coccineum]